MAVGGKDDISAFIPKLWSSKIMKGFYNSGFFDAFDYDERYVPFNNGDGEAKVKIDPMKVARAICETHVGSVLNLLIDGQPEDWVILSTEVLSDPKSYAVTLRFGFGPKNSKPQIGTAASIDHATLTSTSRKELRDIIEALVEDMKSEVQNHIDMREREEYENEEPDDAEDCYLEDDDLTESDKEIMEFYNKITRAGEIAGVNAREKIDELWAKFVAEKDKEVREARKAGEVGWMRYDKK